jgi:phytoene desaturase
LKRPFRGLRDRPPAAAYDAVVIGAGIGGLFAALELARQGASVLLLEQHYMVGGYCSTFRRGGFTFDASTHFYPLLGNPTTITGKILADLGISTEWVAMDPVDTFHFPDGSRFEVPAALEPYRQAVDRLFPHEREGLDRFFEATREAYLHGVLFHFRGKETARHAAWADWTLRRALDTFIADPRLKLLLTADCAHWGSPPSRTSFVFDAMLRLSYFLGNYYPKGGSQAFADELARRFEELGGHILISAAAREIWVENGRAGGVSFEVDRGRLKGSYRVAAKAVVSNGDLRRTCSSLLPAGTVPPELERQLEELRPSFPCFLTHLGLRGVPSEDLDRVQGYYWQDWNPDLVGGRGLRCKIFVPTLYEPEMAPPGGQVVILQKVLELDQDAIGDWDAHKAAVEASLLAHFEAVLPGVAQKIVVSSSASARTARRFTWNEAGAMLGWEMSPDQLGERRPSNRGPVDGLWHVGHWTRPGGGITPVIVSAIDVAREVARTLP